MQTQPITGKVLIADDESEIANQLAHLMQRQGITPMVASDGDTALDFIRTQHPDLLLVDYCMPGRNGLEVMQKAKTLDADLPVVLMTAFPEIRRAVEAIRAGALDYLTKPFEHEEVLRVVRRGLAARHLSRLHGNGQTCSQNSLRELFGPSDAVRQVIADVERVAQSNFNVVILGETGSGKEVLARAIHQASARRQQPFVPVDCGAIPEALLESELFGHERGAFTGAHQQTAGRFEAAGGGTLFLDEISNLLLASQAKLLRVLQDKVLYRVGGTQAVRVEARLLAATNLDLQGQVEAGAFRRDLYFRLNEFVIRIPPLRQRREDIPYLARQFLEITNAELCKQVQDFSHDALGALLAYDWPGNVRQLRSVIRRAVLMAEEQITEQHLDLDQPRFSHPTALEGASVMSLREIVKRQTTCLEREVIAAALHRAGGNKAKAARRLQIDYKTMHSKIKEYGITTNGEQQHAQED